MKKNILTKILIIVLAVSAMSLYFMAPCFPAAYIYCKSWLALWKSRAPTVEEMRRYYENLPAPELTSEQVVAQMREQKGLFRENTELIKQVEWYVYHGDKQVIRQLVANLPFEVEVSFSEKVEKSYYSVSTRSRGESYYILRNYRGARPPDSPAGVLRAISPVLHEELHQYAAVETTDPNIIYLIMELIAENEPEVLKPQSVSVLERSRSYTHEDGFYDNTDWYTDELVHQDILTFLRIHVNYKWPIIRSFFLSYFPDYPVDWIHSIDMSIGDVFDLAEEKGVEAAYELYLKRYKLYKMEHDKNRFDK